MTDKLRKLRNGLMVQESLWEGYSDDEIIAAYRELDDSLDFVVEWNGDCFVAKGCDFEVITSDGHTWQGR